MKITHAYESKKSLSKQRSISNNPPKVLYNKEYEAIALGKMDYQTRTNHSSSPKRSLLCVTFTQPSPTIIPLIRDNIYHMGHHCDWAIIFYNGTRSAIRSVCDNLNSSWSNVIHCQRSPTTTTERFTLDEKTNSLIPLSTPKSVLYQDLLPFLPSYYHVFIMDDDISLSDFNYTVYDKIWRCTFPRKPLITQPLVASQTPQYITYVNYHNWQRGGRERVVASSTGLIEQQVPIFDSNFLQWFIERVLLWTIPFALQYGADWGHDRSWCKAAKTYAHFVLSWPAESVVCALITKVPPVYHLNMRSMHNKRYHRELFRANAAIVLQKYVEFFPSWVSIEVIRPNNPLDGRNRNLYPLFYNMTYCPANVTMK
eukprot:gene8108-8947_t